MASTTSAIGAGVQGACASSAVWRAWHTVVSAGTPPASKIADQR